MGARAARAGGAGAAAAPGVGCVPWCSPRPPLYMHTRSFGHAPCLPLAVCSNDSVHCLCTLWSLMQLCGSDWIMLSSSNRRPYGKADILALAAFRVTCTASAFVMRLQAERPWAICS